MPSLFDWRTGKLQVQLATSRDNAHWNRAGNREIFIHWTTPTIVLKPDEHDPEDTDIYTSAAFKYQQADYAYIMMPSLFDWRTGKLQVQLAMSTALSLPYLQVRFVYHIL